jgi:hypothetical protein
MAGALGELSVALLTGNEVVYQEVLRVYAITDGTVACIGATIPTVDPEYCCSLLLW